jgi:hypothetical protein
LIIRHPDHEYGWWVYVFKKKHLGVNTASWLLKNVLKVYIVLGCMTACITGWQTFERLHPNSFQVHASFACFHIIQMLSHLPTYWNVIVSLY